MTTFSGNSMLGLPVLIAFSADSGCRSVVPADSSEEIEPSLAAWKSDKFGIIGQRFFDAGSPGKWFRHGN